MTVPSRLKRREAGLTPASLLLDPASLQPIRVVSGGGFEPSKDLTARRFFETHTVWLNQAPWALCATEHRGARGAQDSCLPTCAQARTLLGEPALRGRQRRCAWGSKTLALRVGLLSRGQFVLMDEAAEQLAPLDSSRLGGRECAETVLLSSGGCRASARCGLWVL